MDRINYSILAFLVLTVGITLVSNRTAESYRVVQNNSFSTGEKVEYRVHYGFINAAEARVEVGKSVVNVNNRPCYRVNVFGRTVGPFDFISKVRDTWRSYIDTSAILPQMFSQSIQENSYRKEETVIFNHNDDMAHSTLRDEKKSFKVPNNVHDIVSGYYFLRTIDFSELTEGDVVEVPTFFNQEVYKLKVKYRGKDVIKTKFGRMKVLRVTPLIPDNKLFKGENSMKIWVSDDENKIPVKVQVELWIGSIEMDLKSFKGLKSDFTFL
jgi:hypothetical protein